MYIPVRYFGPPERIRADEILIDTPVGMPCILCEESVVDGDAGTINYGGQIVHYECGMRSVIGSVGHLQMACSCYGGVREDPPGMTYRQASKAAVRMWTSMQS